MSIRNRKIKEEIAKTIVIFRRDKEMKKLRSQNENYRTFT